MKPIETFSAKSQACDMTAMSGAFDNSVFDGNTSLLKVSEENDRQKYVYIGGNMVCSFLTNYNIYENISSMGMNLFPYSIAIGDGNICFLNPLFEFIRRNMIDYDNLLSRIEIFVDPCDYHISNCGKESFKKLRIYKVHPTYD